MFGMGEKDVIVNYQQLKLDCFSLASTQSVTTALLNGVTVGGEPLESYKTTSSMFPNCWSMTFLSLVSAKQEKNYRHVVTFL